MKPLSQKAKADRRIKALKTRARTLGADLNYARKYWKAEVAKKNQQLQYAVDAHRRLQAILFAQELRGEQGKSAEQIILDQQERIRSLLALANDQADQIAKRDQVIAAHKNSFSSEKAHMHALAVTLEGRIAESAETTLSMKTFCLNVARGYGISKARSQRVH